MIILEDLGNQYGYEKLAPTSATGITTSLIFPTSGVYAGKTAKAALIGVEDNTIRFRMDGTNPTATEGMPITATNYYTITNSQNIINFRCIDTGAGASSVKVLLFF